MEDTEQARIFAAVRRSRRLSLYLSRAASFWVIVAGLTRPAAHLFPTSAGVVQMADVFIVAAAMIALGLYTVTIAVTCALCRCPVCDKLNYLPAAKCPRCGTLLMADKGRALPDNEAKQAR